MPTDYESLLPVTIASEVISAVEKKSAVVSVSRTIRMPAGVEKIPVVSAAPVAGFVNPAYGGRKPFTEVDWGTEQIVAEELAAVVAVPNAFIDDTNFPVWAEIRQLVANAIAFAFDDAALNGNGAPASYPTGGLMAAAGAAVTGSGPVEAADAALSELEAEGFTADGIVGGSKLNGVMRGVMTNFLVPPTAPPPQQLWGLQFAISDAWDYTAGDELVGDYSYSFVGIRQDIRYEMSTDGVITDALGKVLVNAFQDDTTLMRVYARMGYAIGKPLAISGTATAPFAIAQVLANPPAARSAPKGA